MPKKLTSARYDKVVRLTFATPLFTLIERECETMQMETSTFIRNLIRHQQGSLVWVRPANAKPRRPLTTKDHPTRTFNLYLSSEMYDFLQGLANQCGNSKKGVLSLLTCDYFGILPLALSNPGKSQ